ncbi:MAG: HlyD family efflux transporter periplasmic adaptor subunit [Clostridiales bacterium]|nr:HlyD family efflux transporter periplasmic adaptor subunit [Clostridiales bacterium]
MKIFKKKTLYIVLIILFTLILIADLIIRFAVPSGSSSRTAPGNFEGAPVNFGSFSGDGSGSFDPNNLPEGFDGSNMPQGFDPSSMQDGDFSSMPQGGFGGFGGDGSFDPNNLPEGFDGSNMPQGFDPSSMQGGDFSNMPQGGDFSSFTPGGNMGSGRPGSRSSSSSNKGFIGTVKKFWIPIAIVSVLVDAVCAYMLVRITKQQKKNQKGKGGNTKQEESDDEPVRKKSHWLLILVPILVIAIVLKVLPMTKKQTQVSSVTVKEKVLSADVAKEDISTVYLAGGTLSEESATAISVPGEIKIDTYAVKNGDMVEEGDLIATVNKASVLSQIEEIQNLISELDGELKDALDEDDREKITTTAAGRVKAIYAEEGTSIVDTVAKNGCLAVISLDGLMSVEVPATGLSVGDAVTVILSDESEEAGRVISVMEDVATITISDEKAEMNEEVTIKNTNDTVIGKGALSVHSPLKIMAYQGVAEKVNVEVGDKVKADATIVTLKNAERSSAYLQLLSQRETLSEQMNELFELYEKGEIRAESSGEISGLNEDILLSNEEEETEADLEENASEATASQVSFRSNTKEKDSSEGSSEEQSSGLQVVNLVSITLSEPQALSAKAEPGQPGSGAPEDGNTSAETNTPTQQQDPTQAQTPSSEGDTNQPQDGSQQGVTGDPSMPGDNSQTGDPTQQGDQNGMGGFGQQGGMPSMPSGGSGSGYGNGSGFSMGGSEGTTQETKSQTSYSISESQIYSLAPHDTMSIEVSVDELDIRGLSEGQKVTVTLDALPGQSFDGTIDSIGIEGTYDTGNTKFTVTVSVPRTEQMLSGMNAGIRVELGTPTNCVTVPVSALIEKNGKTYVYTIYDEEDDKLDGLTEITTGLSDGTNVEILSGVSEGSKVYYRYADSIEYAFVRPK